MRATFWEEINAIMGERSDIQILVSDTGFGCLDEIKRNFPGRCINVGIAEQNMIGVAAGMAMEGLTPLCYAIAPFVTMRPFEQVRDDLCIESLNVKLCGIGAGVDYNTLGSTHHADCDIAVMRSLPNMTIYSPCDKASTRELTRRMFDEGGPAYMRLSRYAEEKLYQWSAYSTPCAFEIAKYGETCDVVIVATGKMVGVALEAAALSDCADDVTVIDIYQLKPVDAALSSWLVGYSTIITLEEHSRIGGLGSLVAEVIADSDMEHDHEFIRLGMPDSFVREYGSHDYLLRQMGLDAESVAGVINGRA